MIDSHEFGFNDIGIVHQRLGDKDKEFRTGYKVYKSENYPDILADFNIPEVDEKADHYTHGPAAPHYWKWHNINHLIALTVSNAKYIVFSDSDCLIRSREPEQNWIKRGIEILEKYPEVLIISPGDGATMAEAQTEEGFRLTQNVSQQLFLAERERLMNIDFNIPWDWEHTAPGGPFQEFYYLLEGRIWRYMDKHALWRCILPDYIARYWHFNKLTKDGYFETDYSKY